jgi:hypothetical protein
MVTPNNDDDGDRKPAAIVDHDMTRETSASNTAQAGSGTSAASMSDDAASQSTNSSDDDDDDKKDKFRADLAAAHIEEATAAVVSPPATGSDNKSSSSSRNNPKDAAAAATNGTRHPGAFAVAGISALDEAARDLPQEAETNGDSESAVASTAYENSTAPESSAPFAVAENVPSQYNGNNEEQETEVSAPMLVAELVQPPVEALQVVFDEDSHDVEANPNNRLSGSSAGSSLSRKSLDKKRRRRRRYWIWGITTGVTVLCIVIALAIRFAKSQRDETEGSLITPIGTGNATYSEEEVPLQTFPYECYRSTMEMLIAQYTNPDQDRFIMCPNTTIKIGIMNDPAAGDYSIVNGDVMLMISRDNVEVVCGEDGQVENNCVLDGGFLQVLLQPGLTNGDGEPVPISPHVDNATIRGMTFTGQLFPDPFVGSSSIAISHTGQNIRMVDCLWENITAPSGLLYAGVNPYQLSSAGGGYKLPGKQEIEATFVNCTFRNITYAGGCLISALDQRLTVDGCHFSDIRLSPFVSYCEDAFAPMSEEVDQWCHSLVSCRGESYCEIKDICVDDFEFAGKSAIMLAGYEAEVVVRGTNVVNDIQTNYVNENHTCSSGFSWHHNDEMGSSCMNETMMEGSLLIGATCMS